MDLKGFRHFNKNFTRTRTKCIKCKDELTMVDLTLSNRGELFVRCSRANMGCTGYTIAEKKAKARGVLNTQP